MAKPLKTHYETKLIANANQIQSQILRGLRYFIVLDILKAQPMHGYGLITVIRKKFGIHLGPSSVYPLLNELENWDYLRSSWQTASLHPKRIYELTKQGQLLLTYLESSFAPMFMEIGKRENA